MSHRNRHITILYRRIEFVTWILSIVISLLSIVTLLLSIVALMLSHVHHRIARPLGPPYINFISVNFYRIERQPFSDLYQMALLPLSKCCRMHMNLQWTSVNLYSCKYYTM